MLTFRIILGLLGAEIIAVVCLLAATLLVQARNAGRKAARRNELWAVLVPAALDGDHDALPQLQASLRSNRDWKAFHLFIDEQLRGESGRTPLRLRRLSRHTGLSDRLQAELLHSRDPLDQAAAGKTLARLREKFAEEHILDLLRSDDAAVVLAAAYATASFCDPKQLLPVFRAIYGRTPITLHGAAELLSSFGDRACPAIHRLLHGVVTQYKEVTTTGHTDPIDSSNAVAWDDTAAQVVLIDLLTFYGYQPASPALLQLLNLSDSVEVLIHLVKGVAAVAETAAVPRLVDLLRHWNWVVRDQSLRALATLGATETVGAVEALLDDSVLAVRATAHSTLSTLGALEAARHTELTAALA
jgi:HEAT repeat protein